MAIATKVELLAGRIPESKGEHAIELRDHVESEFLV
jgi:hypothetical protein